MKISYLTDGIFKNNAVFKQFLGLCPVLAVTVSVVNGFSMGVATMLVLICSNVVISIVAQYIPKNIRIPSYIIIIASFVTMVDLFMKAYFYDIHQVLGLFIPLIVVNCIVLGRAEAFASKHSIFDSLLDALGTGIGFTIVLSILGGVRELLGTGKLLGFSVLPSDFPQIIVMILPPGAFITLGFLMAGYVYLLNRNNSKKVQ